MANKLVPSTIERRAAKLLALTRGTTQELIDAVYACREAIAATNGNDDLTDKAQYDRNVATREVLVETVDGIATSALEAFEAIGHLADQETAGADPAVALLHESRLGRAWKRAKAQLDAGRDSIEIAQEAAEATDVLAFEAMAEELPAYLASKLRGEDEIKATMIELEGVRTPLLTPVEVAVREAVKTAERAKVIADTNISIVRFDKDSAAMLMAEDSEGNRTQVDIAPDPETGGRRNGAV